MKLVILNLIVIAYALISFGQQRSVLSVNGSHDIKNGNFNNEPGCLIMGNDYSIVEQLNKSTLYYKPVLITTNRNDRNAIEYSSLGKVLLNTHQQLNGSVWENYYRDRYCYNSNNELDSSFFEKWSGGNWVNNTKELYTYQNNKLKSRLGMYWNSGVWKEGVRYLYTYGESENSVTELFQRLEDQGWVYVYESKNTYDDRGNLLVNYNKQRGDLGLANLSRTTYVYDLNDNIISHTFEESWNGASLQNKFRKIYVYDSQNRLTCELDEIGALLEFRNSIKKTYSYTPAGSLASFNKQQWVNNSWINRETEVYFYENGKLNQLLKTEYLDDGNIITKTTFQYNSNGLLSVQQKEVSLNGAITDGQRDTYSYSTGDLVSCLIIENYIGGQWVNTQKINYAYNNSLLIDKLLESWQNNTWVNDKLESYRFDENKNCYNAEHFSFINGNWVNTAWEMTLYYNNFLDSLRSFSEVVELEFASFTDVNDEGFLVNTFSLFQNYPNPFNPSTTIKYSVPALGNVVMKLYNSLGQEVKTLLNEEKSAGSYELNVNLSDLSSGVYFYRISSGSHVQTKKMMLLK